MSLNLKFSDDIESFLLIRYGKTYNKTSDTLKSMKFKCPYCNEFYIDKKSNHLEECFNVKKNDLKIDEIHQFIKSSFTQTFRLTFIYLKHKHLVKQSKEQSEQLFDKDFALKENELEIDELKEKIKMLQAYIATK